MFKLTFFCFVFDSSLTVWSAEFLLLSSFFAFFINLHRPLAAKLGFGSLKSRAQRQVVSYDEARWCHRRMSSLFFFFTSSSLLRRLVRICSCSARNTGLSRDSQMVKKVDYVSQSRLAETTGDCDAYTGEQHNLQWFRTDADEDKI